MQNTDESPKSFRKKKNTATVKSTQLSRPIFGLSDNLKSTSTARKCSNTTLPKRCSLEWIEQILRNEPSISFTRLLRELQWLLQRALRFSGNSDTGISRPRYSCCWSSD